MTEQPPAAGWYPDRLNPGIQRYWDGQAWTDHVAPMPTPQVVVVNGGGSGPSYVSGLTTGQHLMHGLMTVCTFGLWAPIWALAAFLGRRKIH